MTRKELKVIRGRVTAATVVCLLLTITFAQTNGVFAVLGWVAGLVSVVLSFVLYRIAQRLQPKAEAILAHDDRAPVLFLRPFRLDRSLIPPLMVAEESFFQYEDLLCFLLRRLGPVVAIGLPGEKYQPLGASRLYADDEEWQGKVADLTKKSQLVTLFIDFTPGVQWEIDHVLGTAPARAKTLFVLKPVVTKLEWLLEGVSYLPLIGRLISGRVSGLMLRHRLSLEPTSIRGAEWYRRWEALRERNPEFPQVDDGVVCFLCEERVPPVLFCSESKSLLGQLEAIASAIDHVQDLSPSSATVMT